VETYRSILVDQAAIELNLNTTIKKNILKWVQFEDQHLKIKLVQPAKQSNR